MCFVWFCFVLFLLDWLLCRFVLFCVVLFCFGLFCCVLFCFVWNIGKPKKHCENKRNIQTRPNPTDTRLTQTKPGQPTTPAREKVAKKHKKNQTNTNQNQRVNDPGPTQTKPDQNQTKPDQTKPTQTPIQRKDLGNWISVLQEMAMFCWTSVHKPVIAQLVEHLTVDSCSHQMVPGSIPGDRISLQSNHILKRSFLQSPASATILTQ